MFTDKNSKVLGSLLGFLGFMGGLLFLVGNSISGTLKEEISFLGTLLLGIFAFVLVLKLVNMKMQTQDED